MTDNEIIKDLECWINEFDGKATKLVSLCNALDLIKRLKQENEELKRDAKYSEEFKKIVEQYSGGKQ